MGPEYQHYKGRYVHIPREREKERGVGTTYEYCVVGSEGVVGLVLVACVTTTSHSYVVRASVVAQAGLTPPAPSSCQPSALMVQQEVSNGLSMLIVLW